jgi:hypothetical protein
LRDLQVIGEAAKRVSDGTRASHPEVAWKDMAGMRDRVVHDYFGVSLDFVCGTSSRTIWVRSAFRSSPFYRQTDRQEHGPRSKPQTWTRRQGLAAQSARSSSAR